MPPVVQPCTQAIAGAGLRCRRHCRTTCGHPHAGPAGSLCTGPGQRRVAGPGRVADTGRAPVQRRRRRGLCDTGAAARARSRGTGPGGVCPYLAARCRCPGAAPRMGERRPRRLAVECPGRAGTGLRPGMGHPGPGAWHLLPAQPAEAGRPHDHTGTTQPASSATSTAAHAMPATATAQAARRRCAAVRCASRHHSAQARWMPSALTPTK